MKLFHRLGGAACVALLTACAQGSGAGLPIGPDARTQAPAADASGAPNLYVGNQRGGITVYDAASDAPIRTISDKVAYPNRLAFDSHGDLYVANYLSSLGVTVYGRDSTTLLRELTPKAAASSVAFNARGTLFAGFANGKVGVYLPGDTSPGTELGQLGRGIDAIALDSKGDLYTMQVTLGVAVASEIREYGASGSPSRTYKFTSEDEPVSIAIDAKDNLYVGIKSTKANTYSRVDVFGAGTTSLIRRYPDLGFPAALAFDASDNLYVADSKRSDVYVYKTTGPPFSLVRRLTDEVNGPVALAFDAAQNVYVANEKGDTVTAYEAGGKKLIRTISTGIQKPKTLEFGP